MGRKCAISVCMSDSTCEKDRGVTFHKIPMHPDIRPKWMSLCKIPEDKKLMKVIYICSRHFLSADFCNFKGKKYMLKQGVLPSVFPWSSVKIKSEPNQSIEPEVKLEEGESELVISQNQKDEESNSENTIIETIQSTIKVRSPSKMNLKREGNSTNQSTTIEQKVKTIDTATGPLTFTPNTKIEALDFNQTWCPAVILEVDYQENEVLVHFDKYSNKYDEWICMSSSGLRAVSNLDEKKTSSDGFDVGERCMASWNDARKFPATVSKIIDKDTYEVQFDDGFVKVLKSHRMAKASGKNVQSSPLFDPAKGSKQERRDRKRKINVAALFGKRTARAGSQEDKNNASSTDLSVDDNATIESWIPKWENGKPVGKDSCIETSDGTKKSVIVPDPRLPSNWVKHLAQRLHGASAGKWDTVILNPEGRRFRLRSEIKNYIEEHPELNLKEKMFDFSISRRPTKRSRNESRRSTTSRVTSEPVVVQEPAETTTNVEEEPTQDNLNSLKIPLIDNSYKCPIEGCGKNFRRENLAQMHVKHYHPEYTKYLDSTPNVADLAYARTVGESLDRSPGPEKQQRLSTNTKSTSKLTPKITQKEPNSVLEASHSEIIKLLSSKSDSNKKDEPTSPILPSGLPPSMYPDIKLKDLLTKSEAIPKRDDINMKALISSTQRPSLKIKEEIDTDSPKSSSNKHNQKRKRIASESIEIKQEIKQEVLDPAIDLPPTQPPINNVIIEGGEVIKIVQMKREEIINCTCGITEEDGLMIQCELCLCWQHAYCNNIQRESQVPDKYICYICQNPIRQRSSKKYFHDQDWLKHGTLPVGFFHCKDESILKERFEKLKKTHDLSGGLLELKDYLHTLKVKIKIAEAKNHPKLYLWSKPWEKLPLPEKTEEEASNIKPDDSMLLTLLKNKDSQSSSESTEFPKLDLNTFMGNNLENIQLQTPRIPQPEAAIDSADCRLNLLEHISHSQSLVEERLMEFEDQIDKLDTFLDMDENDIDFDPKVRQTTQMLMRDLNVLKELSQMNTF